MENKHKQQKITFFLWTFFPVRLTMDRNWIKKTVSSPAATLIFFFRWMRGGNGLGKWPFTTSRRDRALEIMVSN